MFSGYDNPTYLARAVALGARGYLSKGVTREEFLSAIKKVADGGDVWSSDVLQRVSGALSKDAGLTPREGQVLKQLAFGLENREIGLALGISYETVKEHIQHILKKLKVSDRTQAAVWAVREGLV
jgi:DNA-binding NarL/FixJ family response regulator